jgi:hypothetical protein
MMTTALEQPRFGPPETGHLLVFIAASMVLHALLIYSTRDPRTTLIFATPPPISVALHAETVTLAPPPVQRLEGLPVEELVPLENLRPPPIATTQIEAPPAAAQSTPRMAIDLGVETATAIAEWAAEAQSPSTFAEALLAAPIASNADPARGQFQIRTWREPNGRQSVSYGGRCFQVWDPDPVSIQTAVIWARTACPEGTAGAQPVDDRLPLFLQFLTGLLPD